MTRRDADTHPSRALALRDEAHTLQAQRRDHALELLGHIKRNLVGITESFYEIGEALAELHNNRLWAALGYVSFEAMLEREGMLSDVQARKLISVATLVPRATAVELGPEKSFALTRYARAADTPNGVKGLLEAGRVNGRPLKDVTVREIDEATRARAPRRPGRSGRRADAERLARQVQATLRKRGLAGVHVDVVRASGNLAFRLVLDDAGVRALLKRF